MSSDETLPGSKPGMIRDVLSQRATRMVFLVFASVLALATAGLIWQVLQAEKRTTANRQGQPPAVVSGRAVPAEGFRTAAKQAAPAVVSILSSKTVKLSPRDLDPFWGEFLGRQFERPQRYRERGLGSGVIVSSDGYVLTNEHVVNEANDIRIVLADKREFKARLVGADSKTDLAVLKVEATNLPKLALADSTQIDVGDIVLAIGNPFGVGQSVTMGIVSAVARSGVVNPEQYQDFIQTDAAINPGNSGGALITARGELIAINTAIISRSGGNQGIGFAIPSNVARHVMGQIVKSGRVIRGWLGVTIQPVDASTARAFGLKEPAGALVGEVTLGSPAEKAGLERGDVILEMNGQRFADSSELRTKIGMTDANTQVTLKVFRDGRERTMTATLGELREQPRRGARADEESKALDGLELGELTPATARELGLPRSATGVVVRDVEPETAAADAGLRQGDVIVEANRKRVRSIDDVYAAFRQQGPILLFVNRRGGTLYIVVEPR